ncbi:sulfatase-like hydrolase/transferase [Winogradskyella eckloniae]|uniref:sulfatase-like hydrolase/transferase n=1 Tax=Winogradskyella eckloniae TaxID=1089306 RepID=UPI0015642F9B|nr:sulfatase-like hydrolase/transferase [Winogradskyella eckloniae]NRD20686.1 sulfatase-like hydrolase/transferase [Winogradskyella eckloniae]
MKTTTLLCILSLFFIGQTHGQTIDRPNVIIFYADDLGWQDTELNDEGAIVPWETPNMLSLAAEGANFSQAYSPAPTCAPSRSAMMSGRHTMQTKMTHVGGGRIPSVNSSNNANKLIHPYFPGRLKTEESTIAEALSTNGYTSGHVGKWHMAFSHNTYPEAVDQGFGFQFTGRGIASGMGDRTTGYATDAVDDPYRIDEDGRPYDTVTENGLQFMEDNKTEPFFLYMATWLVHTPIQTRDLALLTYYCNKLEIPVPTTDTDITTGGQTNPYYGAMVASLDWSLGKIVNYLKETDDPRHPGMKLYDTTYIIFASDNGGAESNSGEIITDNYPLDQGKKYIQEGGIRTPLVITGPDVLVGDYDELASHLDFYPTILGLTGTTVDPSISNNLDGVDLSSFLKGTSPIIEDSTGNERTDLYWHFPHNKDTQMQSAVRSNEFKLYKNHIDGSYELYQLYNTDGSNHDLEETTNIINTANATIVNELTNKLETFLAANNARYPQWNSDYSGSDYPLENQNNVPSIVSTYFDQDTQTATTLVTTQPTEATISKAYMLYTENGSEWFEVDATINGNSITADVPISSSSIVFTLIDSNNFLIISEQVSTIQTTYITLNDSDLIQLYNPGTDHSELIGGTTINGNGSYLQTRTEGGGDGAKFLVKSTTDTAVTCSNITFGVRSQVDDVVSFDVTIGEHTQSFNYTSLSSTDDVDFNFNIPITFTNASQELEIVTTGLTNNNGLSPRFRIYDLTFEIDEFLSVDDQHLNVQPLGLYPNPVTGTFSLSKAVKSGVLYSLQGAKTFEFNDQYEDIDISELKAGLYFLQITNTDGSQSVLKLLKE